MKVLLFYHKIKYLNNNINTFIYIFIIVKFWNITCVIEEYLFFKIFFLSLHTNLYTRLFIIKNKRQELYVDLLFCFFFLITNNYMYIKKNKSVKKKSIYHWLSQLAKLSSTLFVSPELMRYIFTYLPVATQLLSAWNESKY